MGWEDILKRPFDVSRALNEKETREPIYEGYKCVGYTELTKQQILKRYLDPYFQSSLRGGTRVFSTERRFYDKGVTAKPIRPEDEYVTDWKGWESEQGEEEGYDWGHFQTRRTRYPKQQKVKEYELAIPIQDWDAFPGYVKEYIKWCLKPEYIEKKYNIEVTTIGEKNNFGYVLRYRKR